MTRVGSEEVRQSLLSRIAQGEWADGQRLPAERHLAAEYGVARNTLRRALDGITLDGTLVRNVGQGTFMAGDAAEFGEIMRSVTGASPSDLMAVRMILEPEIAGLAATTASVSDLDQIAAAHEQAVTETETAPFEHWDAVFHQRIFAATRNDLIAGLNDIMRVVRNRNPWIEMKRKSFSESRRLEYCTEHQAILTALQSRDADHAAATMRSHLVTVRNNLFGR